MGSFTVMGFLRDSRGSDEVFHRKREPLPGGDVLAAQADVFGGRPVAAQALVDDPHGVLDSPLHLLVPGDAGLGLAQMLAEQSQNFVSRLFPRRRLTPPAEELLDLGQWEV